MMKFLEAPSNKLLSPRRRPGSNFDIGLTQRNLGPGLRRGDTHLKVSQ